MGYHSDTREVVFPFLPNSLDGVLDVGGGYGNTAAALKERFGAKRVGVVDLVASKEQCNPTLDFALQADLDDPATLDRVCQEHGPFSVILCMDVLEHLKEPWDCVKTLQSHLAPGGVIIAYIPNVSHLSVVAKLALLGEWKLHDAGIMDRTHLRFFTKQTARELLECGGLKVDQVKAVTAHHKPFRYINFIRSVIGDRLFAYQYVMRAG
ncbi:MAG: class I SAM-dependent methyltransferase [Pseudomonadota bacterium]